MAQWYWRCRGQATPADWTLLLGIWHEGQFIGCQDIGAKEFAILKTVSTGSWLKQSVHGRGLGKEMRAAVALYAFDRLGAEVAESEAAAWNAASLGVSRSLGYELNGTTRDVLGRQSRRRPESPPHPGNVQAPRLDPQGRRPRSRSPQPASTSARLNDGWAPGRGHDERSQRCLASALGGHR